MDEVRAPLTFLYQACLPPPEEGACGMGSDPNDLQAVSPLKRSDASAHDALHSQGEIPGNW